MLMAHPSVLRELIERYETLQRHCTLAGGVHQRRRMDDVAYTLCVTTGTREIGAALRAARQQLAGAAPESGEPTLPA